MAPLPESETPHRFENKITTGNLVSVCTAILSAGIAYGAMYRSVSSLEVEAIAKENRLRALEIQMASTVRATALDEIKTQLANIRVEQALQAGQLGQILFRIQSVETKK